MLNAPGERVRDRLTFEKSALSSSLYVLSLQYN